MAEVDVDASGMVLASEMYATGVEALEEREFVEAADYLAQCLQFHAERSGDTSIEASVIGLKYAEALLGCARMKGTSVLGTMKQPDASGASTSKAQPPTDAAQGQGEDDLQLAWEVAETARLGFEQHAGAPEVEEEHFGEVHELLGEIGAEMENFPQAVNDYEKAIEIVAKLEQPDVRWEAEMHFKISVALELADRVSEAAEHIATAQTQLKELIKQKEAARQEALSLKESKASTAAAGASSADAAAASETAQPASGDQPAEQPTTAGADAGAAAAGPGEQREGDGTAADAGGGDKADGDEAAELEEEVKALRKVIVDLAEREQELQALQEQEAVIKEQIKAAIGMPSAPADGAGPSSATAAPSQAADEDAKADGEGSGVQDLGVITGKRKRKDENDAPEATANEARQKTDVEAAATKAGEADASVKADTNVA